jgi:hypothetical protein
MTKVREAAHTVACVDEYCAHERARTRTIAHERVLFANVRHFERFTERFTALHLGPLAETERKSLPRLA